MLLLGGFEAINKIAEDSALQGEKCQDLLKEKRCIIKTLELSFYQKTYPYHRMIGDVQISLKEFKELLEDNHKSSGFFFKVRRYGQKKVINSVQFKGI